MSTYQATTPPDGTTCDMRGCGSAAEVRVIVPKPRFEADGAGHSRDPGTWDSCDLHWPRFRDAVMRNGHEVVDTTGDLRQLVADFGTWTVFKSDSGRLYAASYGMTLYGWLVGPLRAEMQRATERASA